MDNLSKYGIVATTATIGHEHTESQYTVCLDCNNHGVGFYNDKECGMCGSLNTYHLNPPCCVEAKIAEAVAAEREACAKIVEENPNPYYDCCTGKAATIRARGEKEKPA